jgi:hypothetical protein
METMPLAAEKRVDRSERGGTVKKVLTLYARLAGLWQRVTAAVSAALLCIFAAAMSVALGVKAPLDYSAFSAAAAAGLLYVCAGKHES